MIWYDETNHTWLYKAPMCPCSSLSRLRCSELVILHYVTLLYISYVEINPQLFTDLVSTTRVSIGLPIVITLMHSNSWPTVAAAYGGVWRAVCKKYLASCVAMFSHMFIWCRDRKLIEAVCPPSPSPPAVAVAISGLVGGRNPGCTTAPDLARPAVVSKQILCSEKNEAFVHTYM